MKKNIGKNDRTIRIVLAAILAILYFTVMPNVWLLVIAVVMAATAALNFCPLYLPFNIKTK